METYVMSMRDEGDSLYHAIVIAPDHTTARRLFAKRMLEEMERTLAWSNEKTLDDYAPTRALIDDWNTKGSANCSSCGSHVVRPMEDQEIAFMGISPILFSGKMYVCRSCGSTWISTGVYAPVRDSLEAQSIREIADLDEFEARSLKEEDE